MGEVKTNGTSLYWLLLFFKTEFDSNNMWIGANDHAKEGQYRWVSDDSIVSFTKWDKRPDHAYHNEDCVEIWKRSNDCRWNDLICSARLNFMCEK